MGFWRTIAAQAGRDTLSAVRLDHPVRICLTFGTAFVAGLLTWRESGGIAWGAVATLAILAAVSATYFMVRMFQIPAHRDAETRAASAPQVSRRALIPFTAVSGIAVELGIPIERFGPSQNNAYHLEGELRQAAVRGDLLVEGRQYRGPVKDNDPLVPIPADHFKDYGFAHGVFGYDVANEHSRTGTIRMLSEARDGVEGVTFYDLHLSDEDVRSVIKAFAGNPKIER